MHDPFHSLSRSLRRLAGSRSRSHAKAQLVRLFVIRSLQSKICHFSFVRSHHKFRFDSKSFFCCYSIPIFRRRHLFSFFIVMSFVSCTHTVDWMWCDILMKSLVAIKIVSEKWDKETEKRIFARQWNSRRFFFLLLTRNFSVFFFAFIKFQWNFAINILESVWYFAPSTKESNSIACLTNAESKICSFLFRLFCWFFLHVFYSFNNVCITTTISKREKLKRERESKPFNDTNTKEIENYFSFYIFIFIFSCSAFNGF